MKIPAPVFFVGHGSPMNAIEDNLFTECLKRIQELCPTPKAILCISAHWMTEGTWVTHMSKPRTIHDFYGFPEELFAIQYNAPGSPQIAERIQNLIPEIQLDEDSWGLDHGTWSVLLHMFPHAEVPVLQLSLNIRESIGYHLNLGEKLRELRNEGVLIVGSGNVVHNLQKIARESQSIPHNWAIEFDEWVKEKLLTRNIQALVEDFHKTEAGRLSVPTLEHYLPMLYILGASEKNDSLKFHFEGIQHASISMRTFSLGGS